MNKSERHAAIRARASEAIADLYHNATPNHPRIDDDDEAARYDDWFQFSARSEIEYLAYGGAHGTDYHATLMWNADHKFTSPAARRFFIRTRMAAMRRERARCNRLDSRQHGVNAQWERITDYGKLYQWGRGGRTLAPDDLVSQRGGSSFGLRESLPDEMSISDCGDLIQIVESFNRVVRGWCDSVPELWEDEKQFREDESESKHVRSYN